MNIWHLRTFTVLAREKNFSRTAEKIHRTQSAVSLQIKNLEDELKTKLVDRINPRRLELTRDGRLFLEMAGTVVRDFDSLQAQFHERKDALKTGEIKIATHEPIITYTLPDVINRFKNTYPYIKILLYRKERPAIIKAVLNGDIDFGITSMHDAIPTTLDYILMRKYNRVLVTAKNHPLSKLKKRITLKDIARYPLLISPESASTRDAIDAVFKKAGLSYTISLEITGIDSVKKYIGLDFGVSILNESLIDEKDRNNYFIHNVASYFGNSERGILKRMNGFLPKYISYFLHLLKEQIKL